MLLTRELEKTSTIGLTRFYVRRAYRILPGAMLFMGAGFVIFWHELRWYQLAAVVLYLVNYDFAHPWFIGHLWSHEQFYFLWPVALKKWYRHRVWILVAALACAPMFRVVCPLAGLYGHGDKAFRPVADILAIGCLLALFSKRVPKIGGAVVCAQGDSGLHGRVAVSYDRASIIRAVASDAFLDCRIVVARDATSVSDFEFWAWLGKMSYGLYLRQQLFAFGEHPRPWYFPLFAVVAATSYYMVEQPMIRKRERRGSDGKKWRWHRPRDLKSADGRDILAAGDFFRSPGLYRSETQNPRLAPWAASFRRFAADCGARSHNKSRVRTS